MLKRLLCLALCVFFVAFSTSCAKTTEMAVKRGFLFNTFVTVTIFGKDGARLANETFDKLGEWQTLFDKNNEGSDVWNINHADGEWVDISDDTYQILQYSMTANELTGGAFDVTIGGVTALWNFGSGVPKLPDPDALAEAVSHLGKGYELDAVNGQARVRMSDADARLDFGGVAKGYIGNQIYFQLRDVLGKNGGGALINLGGDVVTIGVKPDAENWRVPIERAFEEGQVGYADVPFEGGLYYYPPEGMAAGYGVFSSGRGGRWFELNGRVYHQLFDVKTGYPIENDLDTVVVISDPETADLWSTALFLMGSEAGLAFLRERDLNFGAVFIKRDGTMEVYSGSQSEKQLTIINNQ